MPQLRNRARRLLALLGGLLLLATGAVLARRWIDVVAVTGDSMSPALLPGDWLLVERWSLARRPPRPGEIVLFADPRAPSRELVKRVAAADGGAVILRGDNAGSSTDSTTFGPVPVDAVVWRVAGRYWRPRPTRIRAAGVSA